MTRMKSYILTALFCIITASAQAGTLFPPEKMGADGKCLAGQVLRWTGNSVECDDPSDGVTVAGCASGQIMNGIAAGKPVCVAAPLPSHSCTIKNPSAACPVGTAQMSLKHDHLISKAWGDALICAGPDDEDGGYANPGGAPGGDCRIKSGGGGKYAATHETDIQICCTAY